jgi:hypothetical protein
VRSFCGLRHAAFCIAVANRHGTAPDGRCEARRVTPQMLVRNHSGTRARSNQGLREPPSGRRSTPTAVVMPAWPPCSAAGSAPELSVGRSSGPLRVLLHRRNPRVRAGAVPPRPSEKPADRTAWCPLGRDRDSQRRLLALGGQQLRPPGTSNAAPVWTGNGALARPLLVVPGGRDFSAACLPLSRDKPQASRVARG